MYNLFVPFMSFYILSFFFLIYFKVNWRHHEFLPLNNSLFPKNMFILLPSEYLGIKIRIFLYFFPIQNLIQEHGLHLFFKSFC
jgi:hypothetical protein